MNQVYCAEYSNLIAFLEKSNASSAKLMLFYNYKKSF